MLQRRKDRRRKEEGRKEGARKDDGLILSFGLDSLDKSWCSFVSGSGGERGDACGLPSQTRVNHRVEIRWEGRVAMMEEGRF